MGTVHTTGYTDRAAIVITGEVVTVAHALGLPWPFGGWLHRLLDYAVRLDEVAYIEATRSGFAPAEVYLSFTDTHGVRTVVTDAMRGWQALLAMLEARFPGFNAQVITEDTWLHPDVPLLCWAATTRDG